MQKNDGSCKNIQKIHRYFGIFKIMLYILCKYIAQNIKCDKVNITILGGSYDN